MTERAPNLPAPEWLLPLQRAFTEALRAPLVPRHGQLDADTSRFAPLDAALGPRARAQLAVYNRQYWFRLFGVLHREYRLTTALLGPFRMNLLGTSLWSAAAPTGHDLAAAPDALPGHTAQLPWPEAWPLREAVLQALAIDDAHREAFRAPLEASWQPADDAESALAAGRLVPRRGWQVVEESWPLVALRRTLGTKPAEEPLPLPAPHPGGKRAWLVVRVEGRVGCMPLESRQALLYRWLREHPLAEALARLEAQAPNDPALASEVRAWLDQSMRWKLWTTVVKA